MPAVPDPANLPAIVPPEKSLSNESLGQIINMRPYAIQLLRERAASGDADALNVLRKAQVLRAVYAGSFDPFTLGHKDVVRRASAIYDEVVIAIGINPGKRPTFSLQEKIDLIKADISDLGSNIRIVAYKDSLVDLANREGAKVVLRGIRDVTDIAQETGLALVNRDQTEGRIETIFIPAAPEISFVSSSVAKIMVNFDLDQARYLTPRTARALRVKLLKPELQTFWDAACLDLGIKDPAASNKMFQEVLDSYCENSRHYHDILHIWRMCKAFEGVSGNFEDRSAIVIAIMFHDKVYDPKRKDNEHLSAAEAAAFLNAAGVARDRVERVTRHIMATERHAMKEYNFDTAVFLDLDLAILADSRERYDRYASAIRKEYDFVEENAYRSGRSALLKAFVKRDKLFFHPDLLGLSMDQARANMEREIAQLQAGLPKLSGPWHSHVVALTGTIGSGKSSVLRILEEQGAFIVNADQLAREIVLPGTPGLQALITEFGKDILAPDGTLDRSALRVKISGDTELRAKVVEITHPLIQALAKQKFEAAIEAGKTFLVYEVPLLFESGLEKLGFKSLVVVSAEKETCISRVIERDGSLRETVEKLMAAQMPTRDKVRLADIVIFNQGTEEELERHVLKLIPALRA